MVWNQILIKISKTIFEFFFNYNLYLLYGFAYVGRLQTVTLSDIVIMSGDRLSVDKILYLGSNKHSKHSMKCIFIRLLYK